MSKIKKMLSVFVFALVLSVVVFPSNTAKADEAHEGVAIFRLYSPTIREHLFTADVNEKDYLYKTGAWAYEGVAWFAPEYGEGDPVYRLYNSMQHNHLYTMNPDEVNMLLNLPDTNWTIDNDGKPVFYSAGDNSIYRLYNEPMNGMHLLTTDYNEYMTLPTIGNGWTHEGCNMRYLEKGITVPESLFYGQNGPETLPVYTTIPSVLYDMPSGTNAIDNISAKWAIETDVTFTEVRGTGAMVKLVLGDDKSAVAFCIQYDSASKDARYINKPVFMTENVEHNFAGGQTYEWSKYIGKIGETYRLMLAMDGDGNYTGYINGAPVLSGHNSGLAGENLIYPWVEGAARIDGDYFDAKFSNTKVKMYGDYNPSYTFRETATCTNPGLQIINLGGNDVEIKGTITGLGAGYDWDNKYNDVSGRYTYFRDNF